MSWETVLVVVVAKNCGRVVSGVHFGNAGWLRLGVVFAQLLRVKNKKKFCFINVGEQ